MGIQLDPCVGLPTLVAGMLKDPSSYDVCTFRSPKFMKFGLSVLTELRVNFTQQFEWMSVLDLCESYHPIKLL